MRHVGILLLLVVTSTALGQEAESRPVPELDLAKVRQQVTDGTAQLIDVRTEREWDRSHVAKAQHVPLQTLTENTTRDKAIASIDKNKRIYVHCARGMRAVMAADVLCELGFDCQALNTDYKEICAAGFEEVAAELVPE